MAFQWACTLKCDLGLLYRPEDGKFHTKVMTSIPSLA